MTDMKESSNTIGILRNVICADKDLCNNPSPIPVIESEIPMFAHEGSVLFPMTFLMVFFIMCLGGLVFIALDKINGIEGTTSCSLVITYIFSCMFTI